MTRSCLLCPETPMEVRFRAKDLLSRDGLRHPVWACPSCGLLATVPAGDGDAYPEGYWQRIAGGRGLAPAEAVAAYADRLGRLARLKPGGRVLDVGCGDGSFLIALAARGWEAAGTEVHAPVIEALAGRGLAVTLGPLSAQDLPPAHFDLVTYYGSFEHVSSPQEELAAVRRLLGPEGRLVLNLTRADSLEATCLRAHWFGLEVPRHRYNYTPRSLERLLSQAGFQVLDLEHQHLPLLSAISLAGIFGLGSRYDRLQRPLAAALKIMDWMTLGHLPRNVMEVVAAPRPT